jgi:hypothetical protein
VSGWHVAGNNHNKNNEKQIAGIFYTGGRQQPDVIKKIYSMNGVLPKIIL